VKDLGKKFLDLSPRMKKLVSFAGLGLIVFILGIYMYHEKQAASPEPRSEVKFEEVVPEVRVLQKSLYEETTRKARKLENALVRMKEELEQTRKDMMKAQQEKNRQLEERLKELEARLRKQQEEAKKKVTPKASQPYPTPIPSSQGAAGRPYSSPTGGPPPKNAPSWVGGILKNEAEDVKQQPQQTSGKTEQEGKNTVYLPPSFVSADLLNGFAAFSSERGRKEPVRVLLRLKDLAVLPNSVRSDLKGCFVIGETYGDLADERAHVRLLRLSCISRNGSSVIDSSVKGWVVDSDGKAGLHGTVVTKMGAFLTRYMLAGFLQGFGEAFGESQSFTEYSSAGGLVQLPNPDDAAKAGLGKGIEKAGKGLAEFYLDLAKQTLPVIEVGAGKTVTVVFTTGVDIEIKKTCVEGRNGCETKPVDYFSAFAKLG